MSPDQLHADRVRHALRAVVTPVSVVTTWEGDRAWGMTVSAFTTVCLEPPTMAICINKNTATAAHARASGYLGLNILDQSQVDLSQHCSAPGEAKYLADDQLDRALMSTARSPVVRGALVGFDCRATCLDIDGTHLLIAAQVLAVHHTDPGQPLLYGNGEYQMAIPLTPTPAVNNNQQKETT